jgi:sugar-specific transcriptional regulator TrmB
MALGDEAEDRVVAVMKRFGYTGTDARAYMALLRQSPATGYELAARGGVPRSAVYGVLKRLENAGVVNVIGGKPARYVPLAPARLIEHLESRFKRDIAAFDEAVSKVTSPDLETNTWTVTGYDALLAEADRLIDGARESVVCSLWRQEAIRLAPTLGRAAERGVSVVLFSFTALPDGVGEAFTYAIAEEDLEAHWSRRLIAVVDQERLLVGATDGTQRDRAVISDESVLVDMAIANLVLDITLFGERRRIDTSAVVSRLTQRLAPIERLIDGA